MSETDVIEVLASILGSTLSLQVTKEYTLTALMKLTTRFSTCTEQIQYIVNKYTTNTDVELQQRSVEFDTIFRKYESLRPGLLERMPVIKNEATTNKENGTSNNNNGEAVNGHATVTERHKIEIVQAQQQKESDSLLDLLGDGLPGSDAPAAPVIQQVAEQPSASLMDLLGDLDVGSGPAIPEAAPIRT